MNTSVRPKASFRYNRSIFKEILNNFKEIYAIGENDVLRYNRELVITEFVINGFNCISFKHSLSKPMRKRAFHNCIDCKIA